MMRVVLTVDNELAHWIQRTDAIDPAACRQRVEACFSIRRMAENYQAIYRQILTAQEAESSPA